MNSYSPEIQLFAKNKLLKNTFKRTLHMPKKIFNKSTAPFNF